MSQIQTSVKKQPESDPPFPPILSWLTRVMKGLLIGIGAILPGLSGGVLMVIFGIYDPLIRFLGNLRKNFFKNLAFFIPVGIGGLLGILLFSGAVSAAFGRFEAQFVCLFVGFVAGTLPSLYKEAGKKGRGPLAYGVMVVMAVLVFVLMLIGDKTLTEVTPNTPIWVLSGALVGLGFVVPGLSPSNFLMYFGLYKKMTDAISAMQLGVILPLLLGVILCVLLFAKLVSWLFDRYYAVLYHGIVGLVIGSSLALFPTIIVPAFSGSKLSQSGLSLTGALIFAVVLLIVGTVLSYLFSLLEKRYPKEREDTIIKE
ncbi:DUF368 domain-containing protein [Oscillospiraceae bacterium HV4-5-C5C]|nr:DUF368 domain-containing protein [Oscillospiraceae bacterium HV4-5-C5C]